MKLAFALALALAAAGCSKSQLSGKGSSDSPKAKDDKDGSRPSEEGEGLLGYLTDPSRVRVKKDGDQLVVSAPKGTVKAEGGAVEGLPVCVQQVAKDALQALVKAKGGFGGDSVKTLAEGKAAANGSFSLAVPAADVDAARLLTVNVTGRCADAPMDFAKVGLVFKDPASTLPFGKLASIVDDGGGIVTGSTEVGGAGGSRNLCKAADPLDCAEFYFDVYEADTEDDIFDMTIKLYAPAANCNASVITGCGEAKGSFQFASGDAAYFDEGAVYIYEITSPTHKEIHGEMVASDGSSLAIHLAK